MKLNKNKVGLMVGAFIGLFHLLWSVLVAFGVTKPVLNWIYSIHFLSNPFRVLPFDTIKALLLIIFTAAIGYVMGWVLALIWNFLHKQK